MARDLAEQALALQRGEIDGMFTELASFAPGVIEGGLTFHGVTHPVTLTAHFNGAGTNPLDKKYTIGFDAHGSLSRADWGVKTYEPLIGDKVDLQLSGAFELAN